MLILDHIKLGDKLQLFPYVNLSSENGKKKPLTGTVVYINRPHRFFTAEFKFPYGCFRESFKFNYKRDLLTERDRITGRGLHYG